TDNGPSDWRIAAMLVPTSFAERPTASPMSRDLKYVCVATFSRRYARIRRCFSERAGIAAVVAPIYVRGGQHIYWVWYNGVITPQSGGFCRHRISIPVRELLVLAIGTNRWYVRVTGCDGLSMNGSSLVFHHSRRGWRTTR